MTAFVVLNSDFFGGGEYIRVFSDVVAAETYADTPVVRRINKQAPITTIVQMYSAPGAKPGHIWAEGTPMKLPLYVVYTINQYGGGRAVRVFTDLEKAQDYRKRADFETIVTRFDAYGAEGADVVATR